MSSEGFLGTKATSLVECPERSHEGYIETNKFSVEVRKQQVVSIRPKNTGYSTIS